MTAAGIDLLKRAMELPPSERAELVERLLGSFEFPDRQRLDALWAAEAEARIDAFERGDLTAGEVEGMFGEADRRSGS